MSNNSAAPSLFGWDFQINAAIAILIDNIGDVKTVRLEGKKQDIEITLSNGEKIWAQAKSVEKTGSYNNVKKHLTDALESLNNSAEGNGKDVKQFIYITNNSNPLGNMQTMDQFMFPYIRYNYNQLSDKAKSIVDKTLNKFGNLYIDKNRLYFYVLNFHNGLKEEDRYRNIKQLVDDFVETILENRSGIGGAILDVWQKELLLNGSTSNTSFTLKQEDFCWIIVVKAIDNSLIDNSIYNQFDISEVESVQKHFNDFINTSTVRFEFVTSVLSNFNDFHCEKRNEKTKQFINQHWEDYKSEFALDNLNEDTQEILIKTILARIIHQTITINKMKERNLI